VRLTVRKEPLRRILEWSQRALIACAALLLGYCAFALVDAWLLQRRESRELERLLRDRYAASEIAPQPVSPKGASTAKTGGLIGRIDIPRLTLAVVVVEGVDKTTLRRAVGHIPGTALPGRIRQCGPRRAPGHILSSAEGSGDQGRNSTLDVEWHLQVRSRVAQGGGPTQCRRTRSVRREPSDAGNLFPVLLRRAGARAMDRKGKTGVIASGAAIECEMMKLAG